MGTARPGFWGTADHQAAKEFGRRFWKAFVVFRIIRRVWLPVLAVLVVAAVAGMLVWSPPVSLTLGFRKPGIPDWLLWVAGIALLIGTPFLLPSVRFRASMIRYRIFS